MISSKNIRFHASSNTYIIPKNSLFDENVIINGNVIVGSGSRFWKNIKIDGNIQFGKGVVAEGNIKADNIIIGPHSKIKGNVSAAGDVSVFQNAAVKSIESGSTITIMEGCAVGYADGKRLEIIGKADVQKIGVITKVTVRAYNVAAMEKPEDSKEPEEDLAEKTGNTGSTAEEELAEEMENIGGTAEEELAGEIENIGNTTEKMTGGLKAAGTSVEEDGAEIIDSDSSTNSKFSPEKKTGKKHQSEDNLAIPADEMPEVEILSSSKPQESVSYHQAGVQKTIETPFGVVSIDDYSKKPGEREPAANAGGKTRMTNTASLKSDSESIGPEMDGSAKDKSESSESKPRLKSKPWPEFDPRLARSGQTGAMATERKSKVRPAAGSGGFEQVSQKTAASSPSSKEEFSQFQYEEINTAADPAEAKAGTKLNAGRPVPENVRKVNQKVIFEEIEPEKKGVQKSVPVAAKKQEPTENKGKKSSLIQSPFLENRAADDQSKAENKPVAEVHREAESDSPVDREVSKVWYEQRFKPAKPKQKEYPPYI